jgi:hypothetical protein
LEQKKHYYNQNKNIIKAKRVDYIKNNKERIKESLKKYYDNSKEDILLYKKEYYQKNKNKKQQYDKEYRKKNKALIKEKIKRWRNEHLIEYKTKQNNYVKNRLKKDINYMLKAKLRDRIRKAVKNQYTKKAKKTIILLGCSIEHVRKHLESQFTPGMTWENYGKWHIDHIKPCASFDLTIPEQQQICFNYTNLQPLWAEDNLKKSNKIS